MKTMMLGVALALALALVPAAAARGMGAADGDARPLSARGIPLNPGQTAAAPVGEVADLAPDTIREAQEQLESAGFDPGPATGDLHEQTREALRKYQDVKGLPVSGDLDARTRTALRGETIRA
jgi:peptidoglycan hydrolase-like protein with peptidoglycan-binding domain